MYYDSHDMKTIRCAASLSYRSPVETPNLIRRSRYDCSTSLDLYTRRRIFFLFCLYLPNQLQSFFRFSDFYPVENRLVHRIRPQNLSRYVYQVVNAAKTLCFSYGVTRTFRASLYSNTL
uniref:Uncharacterized protein n=1 Tax=Sipha flava TaxID=143950 RepID=A0A2S2Q3I1_9HEMI